MHEQNFTYCDGWDPTYSLPTPKFWNGNTNDLRPCTRVLWRGVPPGKRDGESRHVVFYPAVVQGWDEENLRLIRDGQRTEFSVNPCHVKGDPEREFVIKDDDNTCHVYQQLLRKWLEQVRCPKCHKTFSGKWAWQAHYDTCRNK